MKKKKKNRKSYTVPLYECFFFIKIYLNIIQIMSYSPPEYNSKCLNLPEVHNLMIGEFKVVELLYIIPLSKKGINLNKKSQIRLKFCMMIEKCMFNN